MEDVWYQKGTQKACVLTSAGKIPVHTVADYFGLQRMSITFAGRVMATDTNTGLSRDPWDDIKRFLGLFGTEEKPLLVDGPPASTSTGVAHQIWDNDSIIQKLYDHYHEQTRVSRTVLPVGDNLLYDADLGDNFKIVGRQETYEKLLQATGTMYNVFLNPSSREANYRSNLFFHAKVAFPGAGKTTLGLRGYHFLVKAWDELTHAKKESLLGDRELLDDFSQLVENSRKYNLLMFHEVEHMDGGVVSDEVDLQIPQILALRTLYMVIHEPRCRKRYSVFLKELQKKCPDLKHHITFHNVLVFLRRVLNDNSRLLASFFFDEVNAIDSTMSGQRVSQGLGSSTWFQLMLSEYVKAHFDLASEKFSIFPIVSIASTRFSAANLRFTESGKARSVVIPFRPLTVQECQEVILDLLQRIADTKGKQKPTELTKTMLHIIQLSGGMPRLLASGLRALCSNQALEVVLEKCTTELAGMDLERVIEKWRNLANIDSEFKKYSDDGDKMKVLMKALAASLIRKTVQRANKVMPEKEIIWGDLEGAGLIALTPVDSQPLVDIGLDDAHVKMCPLLVKLLAEKVGEAWGVRWPPVESPDWRHKEIADVLAILLRMFLMDQAYDSLVFRIDDVVGPAAFIPERLKTCEFKLMDCSKKYYLEWQDYQSCSVQQLWDAWSTECSAVLGVGNSGADSFIFCKCSGEKSLWILQSKKSVLEVRMTASFVLKAFKEDVEKHFGKLPAVPQRAKKLLDELTGKRESLADTERKSQPARACRAKRVQCEGDEDSDSDNDDDDEEDLSDQEDGKKAGNMLKGLVYIVCSTRPIGRDTFDILKMLEDCHPWVQHIVVLDEPNAAIQNDPIAILGEVRKMQPLKKARLS